MVSICNIVVKTKAPCLLSHSKIIESFQQSRMVPHFSALNVKINGCRVIVFKNGRINLTGFKSLTSAQAAFNHFAEVLGF